MSWSDIELAGKTKEERRKIAEDRKAKSEELSKKFSRAFNSDDGKVVFEHLFQRFVLDNDTPLNAPNPEYEAGYHNGEAGVIKYITHQITKAKNL